MTRDEYCELFEKASAEDRGRCVSRVRHWWEEISADDAARVLKWVNDRRPGPMGVLVVQPGMEGRSFAFDLMHVGIVELERRRTERKSGKCGGGK